MTGRTRPARPLKEPVLRATLVRPAHPWLRPAASVAGKTGSCMRR